MDSKDYHYSQIKHALLKQKFIWLVITVSALFLKNSTNMAFLEGKIQFTFSDTIVSVLL